MANSISGTLSFGEYVGSSVIHKAVAKVSLSDGFVDAMHRNETAMHREDLVSLACFTASIFAANLLFASKQQPSEYIINFSAGLLSEAVKRGLRLENYEYWYDKLIQELPSPETSEQVPVLLKLLRQEICPKHPDGEGNPADILFTNVGAIFLVASKEGEFTLP